MNSTNSKPLFFAANFAPLRVISFRFIPILSVTVLCAYSPICSSQQPAVTLHSQPSTSPPPQQVGKSAPQKKKSAQKGSDTGKEGILSVQSQRSLELNEQGAAALRGKDFSRAEQLFKQSLSADSKNLTAAYNLAGVYITNKNEKEAIALLRSYTIQYPDDAGLLVRLGDALFGNQEVKEAIKEYKRALEKDSTYPGIAAKLGTLLSLQGDLPQAASMYETALKNNPKDAQVLSNLSSIYVGLSRPKEAVATAKAALQLTPTIDLYVTLGNAYLDLKENENALHAFERAASFGAANPELSKQIDELRASIKPNL